MKKKIYQKSETLIFKAFIYYLVHWCLRTTYLGKIFKNSILKNNEKLESGNLKSLHTLSLSRPFIVHIYIKIIIYYSGALLQYYSTIL